MVKEPSEVQWIDSERRIVELVVQGFSNGAIAKELLLTERTVERFVHDILHKLGLSDRLDLILYGILRGMAAGEGYPSGQISRREVSFSAQPQSG